MNKNCSIKTFKGKKYKVYNDIYYHINTPDRVIGILNNAYLNDTRLKIYYGDVKTGKLWGDVATGYIGRSTGIIKIPLNIYNKRSQGGAGILDNCIVKIEYSNKKSIVNQG